MDLNVLDTRRAAVYTGLAPKTMAHMRCRGDGPPYVKTSRLVMYRVADLDAWLAARVVTSTSEGIAA